MANQGPHIAAEEHQDDADSAISVPTYDDLTSLRSSVLQYQEENGRTYHSLSSGKYSFPNDDQENSRLDLQHNLWLLTLGGKLALCPKDQAGNAKRVLDAGTGTGIWAIDFADNHEEAEVIGVDLSPIQTDLVPPNLAFEIDDIEKEWTWNNPFDFVFARLLGGSLADYQGFINKAFDNLEPGGYLEMQDFTLPYRSDDGTLTPEHDLYKMGTVCIEAGEKIGRRINATPEYKSMMEKAGFIDVTEVHFKWPLNTWPKDKHYKELGAWNLANVDGGLEGFLLAYCTRVLGWSMEETLVFCASVRKDLRNTKIHSYIPMYVIYGRRPEGSASASASAPAPTPTAAPVPAAAPAADPAPTTSLAPPTEQSGA